MKHTYQPLILVIRFIKYSTSKEIKFLIFGLISLKFWYLINIENHCIYVIMNLPFSHELINGPKSFCRQGSEKEHLKSCEGIPTINFLRGEKYSGTLHITFSVTEIRLEERQRHMYSQIYFWDESIFFRYCRN